MKNEKKERKTYHFIVSTEAVNCYGYRILTEGIDTEQYMKNPVVLYMHQRNDFSPKGNEVIGRAIGLKKENGQLIAEIEFDEEDEFARQISGKVERGFIRMASLGADILETSQEASLLLPSQTLETVTRCKMTELSIVDIGGNDEALKLSKNGQPAELQLQKINLKENNMLKTIALALGMSADTTEALVLEKVNELKLAQNQAQEWKEKFMALQKSEADALLDKAVKLGLIPEDLKEAQALAFENDFDSQRLKLSKLIENKEAENHQKDRKNKVKDMVELAKKGQAPINNDEEPSFDYLQKHDVAQLRRIKNEAPERFAQLLKDYQKGVRVS